MAYYIKSKMGWLSSHNGTTFEYWTEYTNRDAQRKNKVSAFIKAKFIQLLWRLQGDKEKVWIEKIIIK